MTCRRRQHQHPTWTYIHGDGKNNIDRCYQGILKCPFLQQFFIIALRWVALFGKGNCKGISLSIKIFHLSILIAILSIRINLPTSSVVVFFSLKCPILQKPCQLASFSNEHFVSRCTLRHRIWRYMPILTSIKQP